MASPDPATGIGPGPKTATREPAEVLTEVFGYKAFRSLQADVISHVTAGGDALPQALQSLATTLEGQVALASLRQGKSKPTLSIS